MVVKQSFSSNIISFNQNSAILARPRLRRLLERAMDYPIVTVCAGSGYGKTRAVHSFLQGYRAHTTWLQVSERDNIPTRFWESYTSTVSLSWPEAGARLMEIGFPETDEAFAKYMTVMHEVAALPGKHIRVFDDFHLLRNPEVLRFFERAVPVIPPSVTLLLISRTMPEINITGLMLKERIVTICEDVLCFTEDEITAYFRQLALTVNRQHIRNMYDDTQGWAFAVNLIGRALRNGTKYERCALDAMKANIFKLIESEISPIVSEPLWRFLLRISLIDNLAASFIKTLTTDDDIIKELELLNAYIRYDYNLGTYMIHHLFLDYLRQHQYILTDEEKRDTYQKAGVWCDTHGYHVDALSYYEKSGNYTAITRKIASFNVQIPQDVARFAVGIFDHAPEAVKSTNPIFPGLHIRLKINLGQLNDETVSLARMYAGLYEAQPESSVKNRALSIIYANWAILQMFMCTYTNVFDFDIYYKKMGECFNKNPFTTIGNFSIIPISAWASLVGTNRAGAQEEYIGAVTRSIPDVLNIGAGCFAGLDDLAWGELLFYRGEFDKAEQYLKQSIAKAQTRDQYTILNRALVYQIQIAFFRGDYVSANKFLLSMKEALSDKDHGVRYIVYDIACGFFNLALRQPEQAPEWLKGDFSVYTHPAFLENYANRVKVRYHYQTRQYSALLAFIENATQQQTLLFARIELSVLKALCLYQLKQREEAIATLTEAYYLAESNRIIEPFIQYAKDMRTLTAAALRDSGCQIPKAWLENINRKSSAFAKRMTHITSKYMAANHLDNEIALTRRETEILKDLSQGLSRSEIAVSQNISVNTVKMVINVIYEKLRVTSLPDAIRIAVVRNIV